MKSSPLKHPAVLLAIVFLLPHAMDAALPEDGLIFHFSASDLDTLSHGDAVSKWPNRGALGGSLSVYASGVDGVDYVAPTFERSIAGANARPWVRFTRAGGQSSMLSYGDFVLPDPEAGITAFAVITGADTGPRAFAYLGKATSPTRGAGIALDAGRVNPDGSAGPGFRFGNGSALSGANDTTFEGIPWLGSFQMAQGAGIDEASLRINHTPVELTPTLNDPDDPKVVLQNAAPNDLLIGGRLNNAGTRAVNNQEYEGLIGEILIYNRLLSPAEIEAVEEHLARRYGIYDLPAGTVFSNPVDPRGADPFVAHHEGKFYYFKTLGGRIEIKESSTLEGIGSPDSGPLKEIYRGSDDIPDQPITRIWGPELHRVRLPGDIWRWWILFSGVSPENVDGEGRPDNRPWMRLYILESVSEDPMGEYVFKNRLQLPFPEDHHFADKSYIDISMLNDETGAPAYIAWSQFLEYAPPQALYLAEVTNTDPVEMANPIELSRPQFSWEAEGWHVNEGPQFLQRNGRTFIVFSVSAFQSEHYALAMLYTDDSDLLNADAWVKVARPVFKQSKRHNVVSTGHHDFVQTPDGQDWIVYHGRTWFGEDQDPQFTAHRHVYIQRFFWDEFGFPVFPEPAPHDAVLAAPMTEWTPGPHNGLAVTYFDNPDLMGPGIAMHDLDIDADYRNYSPLSSLPTDRYSARWEGVVVPPTTGEYTFFVETDDRVRFWLDDELKVDDWSTGPVRTRSFSVDLRAGGIYPLRFEYSHQSGTSVARLHWQKPGGQREPVPYYRMHPPSPGLHAAYFSNDRLAGEASVRLDRSPDFRWSYGTPFPGAVGPAFFSVRWSGTVTAPESGDYQWIVRSNGGIRVYLDDRLLISDWEAADQPRELHATMSLTSGSDVRLIIESRFETGPNSIEVEWVRPDGEREALPAEALQPSQHGLGQPYFESGWKPAPGNSGWFWNDPSLPYWSFGQPAPGWIYREYYPWIFLPAHGWIHVADTYSNEPGFTFMHAQSRQWYHFSPDRFPVSYNHSAQRWESLPLL